MRDRVTLKRCAPASDPLAPEARPTVRAPAAELILLIGTSVKQPAATQYKLRELTVKHYNQ